MKTIKNILIPSDFSGNAKEAISYALRLFENEDVSFYIFNAFRAPSNGGMLISVGDIIKAETEKQLKTEFEEVTNQLNIFPQKVHYLTSTDVFHKAIKKTTTEFDIDLVVMGTKGISNPTGVAIGSNTSKLIKMALCPIIAVPSGAANIIPDKILLAEDYHLPLSLNVLEPLKELAIKFSSHVEILYVKTVGEEVDQNDIRKKFNGFWGDIEHSFHCVSKNDVASTIKNYIHEEHANMVVTLPGKNNIFDDMLHKSVTNKLALNTDIPLLTLHNL